MKWHYTFPTYSIKPYNFEDKENCIQAYVNYMLNRTQSMFEYNGLPDTIPQRILELYLQVNGNVCITDINNDLRVFTGGLGGEPDIYYMPTEYVIANPRLDKSLNLKIDVECVVIPSDSLYIGLLPMYTRYATALMENDLTMRIMDINSRISALISAADDRTQSSAQKYLETVEKGKLGVIADSAFLEGVKAQPYTTTGGNRFTDLIEYEQYLKAGWFNDLGLQANYNMKRESINSNEAQLNKDALLPLIDDMLNCRRVGIEKVNKMYGTNITVDFASSWENNLTEINNILDEGTEETNVEPQD